MIADAPDGALIDVRVIPRAGKTFVAGVRNQALLVRVAAAPAEGMANRELTEFLARTFDVPLRQVVLVAGLHSRSKRVKVIGLSAALVRHRLGSILDDDR
jgi:uncharacterized protein (TIGR00251 family)